MYRAGHIMGEQLKGRGGGQPGVQVRGPTMAGGAPQGDPGGTGARRYEPAPVIKAEDMGYVAMSAVVERQSYEDRDATMRALIGSIALRGSFVPREMLSAMTSPEFWRGLRDANDRAPTRPEVGRPGAPLVSRDDGYTSADEGGPTESLMNRSEQERDADAARGGTREAGRPPCGETREEETFKEGYREAQVEIKMGLAAAKKQIKEELQVELAVAFKKEVEAVRRRMAEVGVSSQGVDAAGWSSMPRAVATGARPDGAASSLFTARGSQPPDQWHPRSRAAGTSKGPVGRETCIGERDPESNGGLTTNAAKGGGKGKAVEGGESKAKGQGMTRSAERGGKASGAAGGSVLGRVALGSTEQSAQREIGAGELPLGGSEGGEAKAKGQGRARSPGSRGKASSVEEGPALSSVALGSAESSASRASGAGERLLALRTEGIRVDSAAQVNVCRAFILCKVHFL